jgi:homoprotocatechuate degradation regulator HpaR
MAIDQFSRSMPMMLNRALDAVMPRFRKIFNEFDLTEQQGRVLRVLWERDSIAFHELSTLTLIAPPSLVGVIDRLQKAKLVERRRSDSDRRKVSVVATEAGRELESQIMPRVASTYAELKQPVDAGSWTSVLQGLNQIVTALDQSTGGE